MGYLPKLKRWLDEAKVKREYYAKNSKEREQLETHIADLEKTIFAIEHPTPRETKSAESGQAVNGSEKVQGSG